MWMFARRPVFNLSDCTKLIDRVWNVVTCDPFYQKLLIVLKKKRHWYPCMIWKLGVVTPCKITEVQLVEEHLTTTLSAKSQYQFILLIFLNCLHHFNICFVALTELILLPRRWNIYDICWGRPSILAIRG